jgi:hypothetical protein
VPRCRASFPRRCSPPPSGADRAASAAAARRFRAAPARRARNRHRRRRRHRLPTTAWAAGSPASPAAGSHRCASARTRRQARCAPVHPHTPARPHVKRRCRGRFTRVTMLIGNNKRAAIPSCPRPQGRSHSGVRTAGCPWPRRWCGACPRRLGQPPRPPFPWPAPPRGRRPRERRHVVSSARRGRRSAAPVLPWIGLRRARSPIPARAAARCHVRGGEREAVDEQLCFTAPRDEDGAKKTNARTMVPPSGVSGSERSCGCSRSTAATPRGSLRLIALSSCCAARACSREDIFTRSSSLRILLIGPSRTCCGGSCSGSTPAEAVAPAPQRVCHPWQGAARVLGRAIRWEPCCAHPMALQQPLEVRLRHEFWLCCAVCAAWSSPKGQRVSEAPAGGG